jgi:hypothetical protein
MVSTAEHPPWTTVLFKGHGFEFYRHGVVTVCEGAGKVIPANPQLVQGMGGYLSVLAETEPIPLKS